MIGYSEGEVHVFCLKSYGVSYFRNVWWDHIPDANCSGVKEHCCVDTALRGYVIYVITNIFTTNAKYVCSSDCDVMQDSWSFSNKQNKQNKSESEEFIKIQSMRVTIIQPKTFIINTCFVVSGNECVFTYHL